MIWLNALSFCNISDNILEKSQNKEVRPHHQMECDLHLDFDVAKKWVECGVDTLWVSMLLDDYLKFPQNFCKNPSNFDILEKIHKKEIIFLTAKKVLYLQLLPGATDHNFGKKISSLLFPKFPLTTSKNTKIFFLVHSPSISRLGYPNKSHQNRWEDAAKPNFVLVTFVDRETTSLNSALSHITRVVNHTRLT